MRDVHTVTTPEHVEFEFELAGIASRALAWAIDAFILVTLILVLGLGVSMFGAVLGGLAMAVFSIVVFVVQWGYFVLFEWLWSGRTPGKRVVGLRVITEAGLKPDFFQAVSRNLLRTVDFLPGLYLTGVGSALLDAKQRRLGDLAAGTLVVAERRPVAPSSIVSRAERHNTFLGDPAVVLGARKISAPERDAMIALGLRRETLAVDVRHELFERLATHLEARTGVARPAYFSPEKYVLNLAAVMLQGGQDSSHRRA